MGKALQTLAKWLASREAAGDNSTGDASAAAVSGPVILIIDDEPGFLRAEASLLRSYGYRVLAANSGLKGLNMMRCGLQDIHVVLLDYRMPEFDGEQTLQQLRRLNPHTRIIAVTGVNSNEIPQSFREGTDYFIQKPVKSEELLPIIKRALAAAASPRTAVPPGNI